MGRLEFDRTVQRMTYYVEEWVKLQLNTLDHDEKGKKGIPSPPGIPLSRFLAEIPVFGKKTGICCPKTEIFSGQKTGILGKTQLSKKKIGTKNRNKQGVLLEKNVGMLRNLTGCVKKLHGGRSTSTPFISLVGILYE